MSNRRLGSTLERGAIFLIYLYRYAFSIFFSPCCRFTPSCSSYASVSIESFGILKGSGLALKRLIKCHPFHPGGYDPVPEERVDDCSQNRDF
ncbi:MAG: membrane protein insertion efficiency factor YidD [Syntrophaceae bacterium]|nr:membrane protein insertion efficiency factor YidD [Syntrophaceae bacterium]